MQLCIFIHCSSDVIYWCADWNVYCYAECVYADACTSYFLVSIYGVILTG